ncbi:MAG TPA: hypothetical protein VGN12_19065 [Pirellulales bacterium]|jgi:hypothetical protein
MRKLVERIENQAVCIVALGKIDEAIQYPLESDFVPGIENMHKITAEQRDLLPSKDQNERKG